MEDHGDLRDWEMLHSSETTNLEPKSATVHEFSSHDVIKFDYFSLDPHPKLGIESGLEDLEQSSARSDDAIRTIGADPGGVENTGVNLGGEFAGVEGGEGEFDCKMDMEQEPGLQGIAEIESDPESQSGDDGFRLGGGEEELGFGGEGVEAENGNSGDGDAVSAASEAAIGEASDCESKFGGENGSGSVGLGSGAEDRDGYEVKSGEGEKKGVAWYKLPFEILKFCVLRVSPVWSLSIAAAVVGLVILKRRLSKMAQKSRRIPLKISVDDKVSQTMVRVARLNEAFSVVKRVPIIRTSLSGTGGVAPWPVVGLR